MVLNSVLGDRNSPVQTIPATPDLGEGSPLDYPDDGSLTIAQLTGDDDNDGLSGEQEVASGSDPFNADSDGDGLADGVEVLTYGTDPTLLDSDLDGLTDAAEIDEHQTNPTLADTDLDGVSDGEEVAAGTNPLQYQAGGTVISQATPATSNDHDNHGAIVPTVDQATAVLPTTAALTAVPTVSQATSTATAISTAIPATAVPTNPPVQQNETTVQLAMQLAESGWLTSDGGVNSGTENLPRVGDLADGTAVRAVLTYSLADIPSDATISNAFLNFSNDAVILGAPFSALSCLQIDLVELTQPLDNTAYDAFGEYIDCTFQAPSNLDVFVNVDNAFFSGQTTLYFLLSFETESNSDTVADLYTLSTAPTLEVSYLSP